MTSKELRKPTCRWHQINWYQANDVIKKFQVDIVVALRKKDMTNVFWLQDQLIRSWEGRAMAVRKATSTSGAKTPGIDGMVWTTAEEKWEAIRQLQSFTQSPGSYKPNAVKRVMIAKPNGKLRPLGIPTQLDRCMQNLILLALDPVAEEVHDMHSYGFRRFRNAGHAMSRIRHLLDKQTAPKFLWDADIKGCFDNISFEAADNATKEILSPLGRHYVNKWLHSGIIYEGKFYTPNKGVPQGGVISPVLANLVLNGLDACVRGDNQSCKTATSQKEFNKLKGCWAIRYADDFIVTADSRERLEKELIPRIRIHLESKGLEISEEKSKIVDLDKESFHFLGWTVMKPERDWRLNKAGKAERTLVIRPKRDSVKKIKEKIKETFNLKYSMAEIVTILNPILRGWCNYFRTSYHSQRTFQHLTTYILATFYNWGRRKHSSKGTKWLRTRYIYRTDRRKWTIGNSDKELIVVPNEAKNWNFHPIRTDLNPYIDEEYFLSKHVQLTAEKLRKTIYLKHKFRCAVCKAPLIGDEPIELHHVIPVKDGGKTTIKNIVPVHSTCHKTITYAGAQIHSS
jgi:RNA-directed DNA polymerase